MEGGDPPPSPPARPADSTIRRALGAAVGDACEAAVFVPDEASSDGFLNEPPRRQRLFLQRHSVPLGQGFAFQQGFYSIERALGERRGGVCAEG